MRLVVSEVDWFLVMPVTGLQQCAGSLQAGYYDAAAGCIPCDCANTGNISCHPVTGYCYCLSGVGGARCTECALGYYDFTPHGCTCQYSIRIILLTGTRYFNSHLLRLLGLACGPRRFKGTFGDAGSVFLPGTCPCSSSQQCHSA